MGPIPQDPMYHVFADQRSAWSIPNFLNVITNLPFLFIGVLGLRILSKSEKRLRVINSTLFIGFLLLTFGSAYYHWSPNNQTLVYDRLPMSMIFMSFLAFILYDRIGHKTGYQAFFLLNIMGIVSVVYWAVSERLGQGDLRWYGLVQFFPVLAIPLLLLLYPASIQPWRQILLMYLFFGLAKFTESFDEELYNSLGNTISGHSLKHLLMAAAGYEIMVLISQWIKVRPT
jgi:predicted neutral ceramidase superfamily lipid hydrolase